MSRLEQAKCPKSPMGAHWWMIPLLGANPVGRCEFCGGERQFKGSSDFGWMDFKEAKERATTLIATQKDDSRYED